MAHELFLFAHEFHEFTRITKRLANGDLIGRTNFHYFNIFGCARHSPNKFGCALACAKIREIRGEKIVD